jgi:hypothetical protein
MGSGRHVISQFWQEHHAKMLLVAVLAWVVLITVVYQTMSARRNDSATSSQGMMAKSLPVGGLPVT